MQYNLLYVCCLPDMNMDRDSVSITTVLPLLAEVIDAAASHSLRNLQEFSLI